MINVYANLTIGDLPARASAKWGDREALVYGDERWTFSEMAREVDKLASALIKSGIEPRQKVGLWFTNCPRYIFLFFAIAKIDAVVVPMNTRYRSNDIEYCVGHSECSVLIYAETSGPIDFGQMVETAVRGYRRQHDGRIACDRFPLLERLIVIGERTFDGAVSLDDLLARAGPVDEAAIEQRSEGVVASEMAMIVYTSGTTGDAKGVMLSHLGVQQCILRSVIWGTTQQDRQLHYLPMFHLYAIGFVTIPSVALGSCQILMDTFDGALALDLIEKERATVIHGFDPHYRDLMTEQKRSARDISSLRMGSFPSGPDNCIPVVIAANEGLCPIVPSFGLTETWSGTTAGFLDCSTEQRSVASGYPLPGIEFRVVDPETGQEQPVGLQGELLIRSAALTLGYYRMPDETAQAIDADGFLHTGDAGYLREDGYVRFTGRYKDMLKVGGENVSPAEVELLLAELAGVAEVSVVGYPDRRLQEVAAAFIVPSDHDKPVGLEDVLGHCRGKVASFKIPRQVFVVKELPMTPSGKIQKAKLRDIAMEHYRTTGQSET